MEAAETSFYNGYMDCQTVIDDMRGYHSEFLKATKQSERLHTEITMWLPGKGKTVKQVVLGCREERTDRRQGTSHNRNSHLQGSSRYMLYTVTIHE